ncbi:MAG: hypothetical protein ACOX4G_10070 [Limnochordia bacterium]|jgi:hypothetical protein
MLGSKGICDQFGLKCVGVLRPRDSLSIESSRCGVGCETLDRDLFDYRPVFPQMGEYDSTWLDDQVNCLLSYGIRPWFCVGFGNPIYPSAAAEGYQIVTGQVPLGDPETEQAWVSYVKALVAFFRDRVTHYEIWNEPDNVRF